MRKSHQIKVDQSGFARGRTVTARSGLRLMTLALAVLAWVGPTVQAATITVFAAASLTDGLTEIARDYGQRTGDKIEFNFAASSVLERQIEEGAPADIFFSADEAKMDALDKKGLIEKKTRRSRLSNTLVIVTPTDGAVALQSPRDLAKKEVATIALADPRAVPAGIYAKEYLEKLRLWDAVASKVVPTANVRAALAAVESGNADAGIVYKTDAAISRKARVAFEVPRRDGPAISYPMALLKESPEPKAARAFLDYLGSEAAGRVFARLGFIVDSTPP